MPRKAKGNPVGRPRAIAHPSPDLVRALSLGGIPRGRIAELLGLGLEVFEKRYAGHLKGGPKMPSARIANLVDKLVRMAERAKIKPEHIPAVLAVVKFLAPLHLSELHKSTQGDVAPAGPPQVTIIGADVAP